MVPVVVVFDIVLVVVGIVAVGDIVVAFGLVVAL